MTAPDRSVECAITWRHDWAPHLFSFRTVRPAGIDFVPGQFVRLGLAGVDGAMVWRAYSIASSVDADFLEFYSIVVPGGPFTQPLARSIVGDAIRVDPTVYGFLRDDRFVGGRDLWLLATGTGLAPFLPMLSDATTRGRYDDIVIVHSVRRPEELAYREAIDARVARPTDGARLHYLPTLTGATAPGIGLGRITTRLADGSLERAAGLSLSPQRSRLMICGNPAMIRETRALLGERGMTPMRRETPGQFISENFW